MKQYGLIGKKLAHSFSKPYFTKKFEKKELDANYQNYEFDDAEKIRPFFKNKAIHGLNVTIPYKESIISHLDELDEIAKRIGAVNTIAIKGEKWIGYNTDYYGFMTSLKPFLENKHDRALVLGSGGASKAIQYALELMNIPFHVVSRRKESGDLNYETLNQHVIQACKLIVNTTPLGTYPRIDSCPPIPYEFISSDHLIYDLVYNPSLSLYLKNAEAKGALIVNGTDMLKHQAEKAWAIWNNQ